MTAERLTGENPPDGDGLPASPANGETPAVILCLGIYAVRPYDGYAECTLCGVTGPWGENCQQAVIV